MVFNAESLKAISAVLKTRAETLWIKIKQDFLHKDLPISIFLKKHFKYTSAFIEKSPNCYPLTSKFINKATETETPSVVAFIIHRNIILIKRRIKSVSRHVSFIYNPINKKTNTFIVQHTNPAEISWENKLPWPEETKWTEEVFPHASCSSFLLFQSRTQYVSKIGKQWDKHLMAHNHHRLCLYPWNMKALFMSQFSLHKIFAIYWLWAYTQATSFQTLLIQLDVVATLIKCV